MPVQLTLKCKQDNQILEKPFIEDEIVNQSFLQKQFKISYYWKWSAIIAEKVSELIPDLIISYGDIVYQLENLEKVIASDADISIMVDKGWRQYWELRFNDPLTDAESLILNNDNNIMQLGKKTQTYSDIQGQYTGLIKIRSNKVEEFIDFYKQLDRQKIYDGKSFDNMYMTSFLQSLIDAKWKVQAVNVNHGWLEVDTVSDLELYEKLAKENKLNAYCKLS